MTKFFIVIIIFICWFTISITTNDDHNILEFQNYELNGRFYPCKDNISLNFNATIINIGQDFISDSLVTCLNLMDNNIRNIDVGAFNKLPNITKLFLSNNKFEYPNKLLSFEGHENLKILFLNNVVGNTSNYYRNSKVNILGKYPKLEILSMRHNSFKGWQVSSKEIPLTLHSTYPTKVVQEIPFPKLKFLDLSENLLTDSNFVRLLPNSLHFLDLHQNNLYSLDLSKIGSNLSVLNLDNNSLNYIYWHNPYNPRGLTLANLKNLQSLSISKNEIDHIESNTFQDMKKLVYLNLSDNNINYLHPTMFAKLQSLSTLDLSKNKFENIPHIADETRISTLFLNHNMIKRLNSNAFVQTPNLTTLLLGNNEINEVDVKTFAHLFILEKLDLSWNKLSSLPEGWAEHFVSLKYLDLSHNEFISLESLSLSKVLPLMEIYLAMNTLEFLNIRFFESLPENLTVYLT